MSSNTFPAHWQVMPLAEAVEALIDYRGKTPKKTDSGIPLVTAKIVKGGTLSPATEYIAEENYESWMVRGLPEVGDVVVTTEAPLGEVAQLTDANVALAQRIVTLRGAKGLLLNDYLRYAMQGSYVQGQLESRASGSTVKGIKQSELRKVLLPIPSLQEQGSIATCLKAIDDKIQLNHRINQTLEQMAQAIFKSWFVDFEPVKAKAATLDAGGTDEDALLAAMQVISGKDADQLAQMQAEQPEQYAELRATAELFPSAMQDSELGEIPEGWVAGELSDLADLNKRSWSKKTIPIELIYIDLSNTKSGTIESTTRYTSIEAPSRARRRLADGDTIIGTVRPGNKSFAFIKSPEDILTASTGFAVLSPKKAAFAEFVYVASTSEDSIAHLAHLADGGAYPAVRPETVAGLACVIPTMDAFEAYNRAVACCFSQRHQLQQENSYLADMRDTLLPKLLSGELTLPDTEEPKTELQDVAHV